MIAAGYHELSHGRARVVDIGAGPPLVMIHGLGGTWRNWEANISALARNHRVIAVDLPGFGRSARYEGAVTMHRFADTVVELLDVLGIESATFVGNSMGGLLSIEAAARHPGRVRGAVLVCSGGLPLTSLRHRLVAIPRSRALNQLLRLRPARRLVTRNRRVRNVVAARIVHDPETIPAPLLAKALAGLGARGFGAALSAGLRYDARIRAPLVRCPTLVLWGREDPLLPVSMGEELARLVPGAQLEVWERIGHCPMLEDPPRFDALVARFVAEQQLEAQPASS